MRTKIKPSRDPKPSRSQSIRAYLSENPSAMPKDVVAALKGKGMVVAPGLVGLIKHQMKRGAGKAASKAIKKPAVAAKKVGRPKSGGVNKSQAIRDYLASNPGASPADVKAALRAKGIVVSDSLVGAIKYRKAAAGRRTGRPVGRPRGTKRLGRPPAASKNGSLRAEDLIEAKRFVDRVGGTGAARKALDLLARLS